MDAEITIGAFEAKTRLSELFASFQEIRASIEGTVDVEELIEDGRR